MNLWVQVFDHSDDYWNTHLSGARGILRQYASGKKRSSFHAFLLTLFTYHHVLEKFSEPFQKTGGWPVSEHKEIAIHSIDPSFVSLILIHVVFSYRKQIIGCLGCSLEVMEMIQAINDLRCHIFDIRRQHDLLLFNEQKAHIKTRLQTVRQTIGPTAADESGILDRSRIIATAELYRLSTLLYLEQTSRQITSEIRSGFDEVTDHLTARALNILDQLEVCTSPWPLFITACEVRTDEGRIKILDVIDKMNDKRRIGNVSVLKRIIQIYWNQQDLRDSAVSATLDWRQLVNTKVPCFI